jgi:hypothetical protein
MQYTDFGDDLEGPRVQMRKPTLRPELDTRMPVAWNATDDLSGVQNVDVRFRTAGRNAKFTRWSMWLNDTKRTSAEKRVRPGRTYCFSARGRDRQGKVGRWSPARCTATPVNDRAAKATAGWKKVQHKAAYKRTLTTTRKQGQRLVLRGVRGRQLSLVARSCPRCGVVTVSHGDRSLGRVNLRSARVRNQRVYKLATYRRPKAARLVVRLISRGKPVQIDGFVIRR